MSRYLAFAFVVGLVAIIGVSTTRAGQPPIVQATFIEGGFRYTCAIAEGGALECWGLNNLGQLGDGTSDSRHSPVLADRYTGPAVDLALSDVHTCALSESGGVMCWGDNSGGYLGDGGTLESKNPVQVDGLESGVSDITSGELHSCAVLDSGGARCWGANYSGQLGDGTYDERHSPVDVLNIDNARQIEGGEADFTCLTTTDNAAKCWGANYDGQIGDGTSAEERLEPAQVEDLTSGVDSVIAGGSHSCALMMNHEVFCWGYNAEGQLGNGTTSPTNSPVRVHDIDDATAITAGANHTCALRQDARVWCWGNGGLLGDGTNDTHSEPVLVDNLTDATAIAAGYDHTCAIRKDGSVWCWGRNGDGQLGDGTTDPRLVPVQAELVEPPATPTPQGGQAKWGDDDCDSDVDSVDSLKNLRFVAALSVSQAQGCPAFGIEVDVVGSSLHMWGDVDCDEDVDSVDALKILRNVAALPVNQPKGCPDIGSSIQLGRAGA